MKALILIFVLGVMFSANTVWATKAPRIEVQGHRGARAVRPENTLAGFDYALKQGVDVLEMDLLVSKDNVVIVAHDPFVNTEICFFRHGKKLKGEVAFRSLTLKQVKKLDCGSRINPRFPKQRPQRKQYVPTLEEVILLVKNSKHKAAKTVRFNLETKLTPGFPDLYPTPEAFVKLVHGIIKKHGIQERTILQSFDHRTLVESKKLTPSIKTAVLYEGMNLSLPELAKTLKVDIVSPHYAWITQSQIKDLKEMGVKVIPWTVNNPQIWDVMLRIGVDGIITDNPAGLIAHLKKNGLR